MRIDDHVLVLGVYLSDCENLACGIIENFASSRDWIVHQRWVAIGNTIAPDLAEQTVEHLRVAQPKFSILNRQLSHVDSANYAFVIVVDDDVVLPDHFLDGYLDVVKRFDFKLAQPARTHDSYTDHMFVKQLHGIVARQTRFVEIGPVFSVRAEAVPLLVPFDERSPMGWGFDFAWPVAMEKAGLKMGIVDQFPVAHKLRRPVTNYVHQDASSQMESFLSCNDHLEKHEAFRIIQSFV